MSCKDCAYNKCGSCRVMHKQFEGCWAWADKAEKARREAAIKEYSGKSGKIQ